MRLVVRVPDGRCSWGPWQAEKEVKAEGSKEGGSRS